MDAVREIKILLLEDVATDAELIERALRQAGLHFTARRVETKDAFVRALREFAPDLVLSDYNLPDLTGLEALEIARQSSPDLPVIEVTGALSDEAAVALVRAGAGDYVLKDHLARLPVAVTRVLAEREEVRQRESIREALRRSEEKFRGIVETLRDWIWAVDENDAYTYASPYVKELLGYEPQELLGKRYLDLVSARDAERVSASLGSFKKGRGTFAQLEAVLLSKDGREVIVETGGVPVFDAQGSYKGYQGISHNITERKQAELVLKRVNRALKTLSGGNQVLVRASSETDLLHEMCRVIVEHGGYRMAWIAMPRQDAAKTLVPAASAGEDHGYFEQPHLGGAHDISAIALQTGQPQTSQNIAADPRMISWQLEAQKRGFLSSGAFPLKDATGVFAVLTIYAGEADAFDPDELQLLNELAGHLAYGIKALRDRAARETATQRWRSSLEATIGAIASTVEMRDPYTAGHQRRVAQLAGAIAKELRLPADQIDGIYLASVIHDVGKITVPAEILCKPGQLSSLEFQLIQVHPVSGYEILKAVDFPWPIALTILQHHERLDGSGYPNGIKGDQILLEARIVAVADVVEAMVSHRPYRPARGLPAALAEIQAGRGRLFDAAVVDACVGLFGEKGFGKKSFAFT